MSEEIRVRLPRKLAVVNNQLRESGRLHPVGPMGVTLNLLPLNRVTMTLSESDLPMAIHDLVEVYNQNGSVGVYRVKHIGETKRKDRQIELAHALDTLSDAHLASIEDYRGTVDGMLAKIIAAQKQRIGGELPWRLGTVEDTGPWKKEIKYDNALECLMDIAKTEEDYMFTFDMSGFPWVLNHVRRDSTVMSEWRMNRNVDQCQISWDDGDQCTRLYLSVTDEDSETVTDKDNQDHNIVTVSEGYYPFDDAEGQADWGIVEKTAGVDRASVPTQAALDAWVAGYFNRHRQPALQIQIDGQEYSRITGESLDEAHMGRIARVTMPEYQAVFNERLVSVVYPDALRKPTLIRGSLANKRQTSEGSFAEIRQKASRASSGASSARAKAQNAAAAAEKQKIVYDLKVEQDNRHFAIIASEEWYEQMENDELTLVGSFNSQFQTTAREISSAVTATGLIWVDGDPDADPPTEGHYEVNPGAVSSSLYKQLANQITQSAQTVTDNITARGYVTAAGAKNAAWADIGAELKDSTTGVITSAKIKALVEGDTSLIQLVAQQVQIDADDVTISGDVKLSSILGVNQQGYVTINGDIYENGTLHATNVSVTTGAVQFLAGTAPPVSVSLSGSDVQAIKSGTYVKNAAVSQDGLTLTLTKANDEVVTFSRAASGVSVSWSGTTGTVTVLPQNQNFTVTDDAQVSSFSLLKVGSNITIAPYINHGQTDSGGNPTNERNSSSWNISAAAPALTGAIPSGHNVGTGVGPAPTSKSAIAPGDTVIPYVQIGGKYFYGSSVTVPPATAQQLMKVVKADSQIVLASDGTLSTVTIGKPAISTNKPANTLPNVITTLTPGQTFYPHVKVGNDYFYGDAITAPSGANVESSHPHTMSANTATVTPSNGYDAMAQVVVDATSRYYAGKAAVTLSSSLEYAHDPSSTISYSSNTVKVKTSGRTDSSGTADEREKSIYLYSQSETSGLDATFYVTVGDSQPASRIIKKTATCSDANLTAANIKSGVTIFGVTGSYTGSSGQVQEEGASVVSVKLYENAGCDVEATSQTLTEATTFYPAALLSDGTFIVGSGITFTPSGSSGSGGGSGGGGDDPTPSYSHSASLTRTSITINNAVDKKLYVKVSGSYVDVGTFSNDCYYTASGGPSSSSTTVHYGSNYGSQATLVRHNLANYSRDDSIIYMEVSGGTKVNSGISLPDLYYTSGTNISNNTTVYW